MEISKFVKQFQLERKVAAGASALVLCAVLIVIVVCIRSTSVSNQEIMMESTLTRTEESHSKLIQNTINQNLQNSVQNVQSASRTVIITEEEEADDDSSSIGFRSLRFNAKTNLVDKSSDLEAKRISSAHLNDGGTSTKTNFSEKVSLGNNNNVKLSKNISEENPVCTKNGSETPQFHSNPSKLPVILNPAENQHSNHTFLIGNEKPGSNNGSSSQVQVNESTSEIPIFIVAEDDPVEPEPGPESEDPEPDPGATVTVYAYNNFRGPSETFANIQECITFHRSWHGRISSMNTHGTCVDICQYKGCSGRCMRVEPGTLGHNRLRDVNMDKRITSVRPCRAED